MLTIYIAKAKKANNETIQQMYTGLLYCITDGTKTKEELHSNINWQQLYFYFRLARNHRT